MADPIASDQNKVLSQLREMVSLLETNKVTSNATLKRIGSYMQIMPEIPNSTIYTFDRMPKEVKFMILKYLETNELLIVAHVSKEWTALAKEIVEKRKIKKIELGRNIWGEDAMPVEQVETLLKSLANLELKVTLKLSGADVEGLVEKVGLKLFVDAVLGVIAACVEIHSREHLRELLASMGSSNIRLECLVLCSASLLDLEALPKELLLNLTKLTALSICQLSLMPKEDQPNYNAGNDFTKVLLTLAENQLKRLKIVILYGGYVGATESVKITKFITSLERFHFISCGKFAPYGELFTALAHSNSKLLELELLSSNFVFDEVDTKNMVAALTSLKTFHLQFMGRDDSEARIEALQGMPGVSVCTKERIIDLHKG